MDEMAERRRHSLADGQDDSMTAPWPDQAADRAKAGSINFNNSPSIRLLAP